MVAFAAASYLFLKVPLERAVIATIFTLLAVGFGYYTRVRPNVKINRDVYIALGANALGFTLWISLALILDVFGVPRSISRNGLMSGLPGLIACYIVGGAIGDWIGKRSNYLIPLYP